MTLKRQPNETEAQYHKRLVYGKLVDKSLSNIDYTELSTYAYGKPYSSDVARRMFYGSAKTIAILEASGGCPETQKELEEKRQELQKEAIRLSDQRRELMKLIRKEGRAEHLYERLIDAANHLSPFAAAFTPINDNDKEREAVLVLSDWHYGMTTDNIFNKFDTQICEERIARLITLATERLKLNRVSKLHIVVLGDLIHGAIHVGTRVAAEELVCDQLMQVSELLAQAVYEIAQVVSDTVVYTTYGNHARTIQSKADSVHRDNLERIVPWWLKERFKNCSNITVQSPSENEFVIIDTCGGAICATHGDLDNIHSTPIILSNIIQKATGKHIEAFLVGDKHHQESIEKAGVSAIICSSLCGTDEYANTKRLYSTPSQLLITMTEGYGIDGQYHLKLA